MIPEAFINNWRMNAPWQMDYQVEQDLLISRAIIEIFSNPLLSSFLLFRGGTVINKLYLDSPLRYSEDIDLVQIESGPIGNLMSAIRESLNPWLGRPRTKQSEGRVTFVYRNQSEIPPQTTMRIKIEINTQEHFTVYGIKGKLFKVDSPWFSGETKVQTYKADEIGGTKLRALYQRKKGRDLFDLFQMIQRDLINGERSLSVLEKYTDFQGVKITRRRFQQNLEQKIEDSVFIHDTDALILPGTEYDVHIAAEKVIDFFSQDSW